MYGLPTGDTHPVQFSMVSIRRQNEISSGPEMPPHETPLSLSGHPTQMERTPALDESDHLRHRIPRRDRYQHMHLIHQQAAFVDSPFLLLGQLAENLPGMIPQFHLQRLSSALLHKCHMVFALPFRVA